MVVLIFSIFIVTARPVLSQLDISYVDRTIRQSKTFLFDYYGNFDYLKSIVDAHGTTNWNNKLVFNRTIEKGYQGNWQIVNFELTRYKNGKNRKQVTRLDSKIGGKRYLGNTPYFVYGVFEAREYGVYPSPETASGDIFKGSGIYSFVTTGGGGGRILDIANRIRAIKTLDALRARGYLTGTVTDELFRQAENMLRQKKESTKRAQELNALLAKAGVLSKDTFDADTIFALTRILDASSEKLETGLEWRAGLGHELSKENSRQDKLKLIGGRIYYGKALNDRMGVTESMDFLHGWGVRGEGNDLRSFAQLTHSRVKTELSLSWRLDIDMRRYAVASDSTSRNYRYSSFFNEFVVGYSYEIYNRLNLTAVMKINRKDYHNDFTVSGQKRGWNREFHAMLKYEIL